MLLTFINLPFVIKTFVLSILRGCFTQVLRYLLTPTLTPNFLSLQEKSLGFPGAQSLARPAASPTYIDSDLSTCKTRQKCLPYLKDKCTAHFISQSSIPTFENCVDPDQLASKEAI